MEQNWDEHYYYIHMKNEKWVCGANHTLLRKTSQLLENLHIMLERSDEEYPKILYMYSLHHSYVRNVSVWSILHTDNISGAGSTSIFMWLVIISCCLLGYDAM